MKRSINYLRCTMVAMLALSSQAFAWDFKCRRGIPQCQSQEVATQIDNTVLKNCKLITCKSINSMCVEEEPTVELKCSLFFGRLVDNKLPIVFLNENESNEKN